jgi:hypothetical protein
MTLPMTVPVSLFPVLRLQSVPADLPKSYGHCPCRTLLLLTCSLTLGLLCSTISAAIGQTRVYTPLPVTLGKPMQDKLSKSDIPTGQGGFSRDYTVQLEAGNQIAIDLTSDNFDTIVYLINAEGNTVAENDDGPDGTTNSLLFTRISKTGLYYVRVRSFGEVSAGNFTLRVTLLKPQ